jgi:hypothetical protein
MTTSLAHPDYPAFLGGLKTRILHARTSAAHAVNHDLGLLCWDISRGIVEIQQTAGLDCPAPNNSPPPYANPCHLQKIMPRNRTKIWPEPRP